MFLRTLVVGLFLLCMAVATPARAQSSMATLSGTVVDGNAAALPNTNIAVVNVETGQRREVASTADGTFTVPLLPPGAGSRSSRLTRGRDSPTSLLGMATAAAIHSICRPTRARAIWTFRTCSSDRSSTIFRSS